MNKLSSLAAVTALTLLAIGRAAAAGPALVPTSPPEGSYTLLLPAGWQLVKTAQADHSRHTWRDPANSRARVTVTLSHCRTCVTNPRTHGPDPNRLLPHHLLSSRPLSRWQVIYTLKPERGRYQDEGTIIVLHHSTRISGYTRIDAQLPSELQSSSAAILTSFAAHDARRHA